MPSNASKTGKSDMKSKEEQRMKDTFSEILFDLIKDNNTTSDMVSKSTDIAKGTISNYLNAKTSPKPLELKKLADHFNVSTDYLLGRTKAKTVDTSIQAIHKKTGLSAEAITNITKISSDKTQENSEISEIVILSKLLEKGQFFKILNDIMWLEITAMHKFIFESEKREIAAEPSLEKTLGKPIYELLDGDNDLSGLNRLFGGPIILNPSETYSFYLSDLEKDFGKIVETIIEEPHRFKDLAKLKDEVEQLTHGFDKGYFKGY